VNRFWSFTDLLFWVYGFPVAVLFCCGQWSTDTPF
jgi:hypothetical protein